MLVLLKGQSPSCFPLINFPFLCLIARLTLFPPYSPYISIILPEKKKKGREKQLRLGPSAPWTWFSLWAWDLEARAAGRALPPARLSGSSRNDRVPKKDRRLNLRTRWPHGPGEGIVPTQGSNLRLQLLHWQREEIQLHPPEHRHKLP